MIPPTLTTQRLLIEPLGLKHWESYAAAWADPRMTQFISPEPRTRQESWMKFLQGAGLWPMFGYGYLAFCDRESGAFLGNGGLARMERGIRGLEGYPEAGWAFLPDAWNKGYATEAMAAVLGWADRWIVDLLIVQVPSKVTWACGFVLRFLQFGNLQAYAFFFGAGVVGLLYLLLSR